MNAYKREIQVIETSIYKAHKYGYRIQLGATFVDSASRTCCPMGAVMMFGNYQYLSPEFVKGFIKGFDNQSPSRLLNGQEDGYMLGRMFKDS